MQNILKKMASDFNLFSLNNPETTRFYIQNIDFFINNFPYFVDLPLVSSYFCSDNKKFNSKFFTRITKFLEIIRYDSTSRNVSDDSIDNANTKRDFTIKEPYSPNIKTISRAKPQPSYFAQFLRETDSKPFTLDSDSDSESDGIKSPKMIAAESLVQNENQNFDLPLAVEKLKIKNTKSNSLIEVKHNPNFPNHFPEGRDFIVNPTSLVMKHFALVLSHHLGKFLITPPFINQIIRKLEFEDIAEFLCKLINQNGVLATVMKSHNLKQIIMRNLSVFEMILESITFNDLGAPEEEMLLDQIFNQKSSLIYRFFENGIAQGYVEPNVFEGISIEMEGTDSSDMNNSDSETCDNKSSTCLICNKIKNKRNDSLKMISESSNCDSPNEIESKLSTEAFIDLNKCDNFSKEPEKGLLNSSEFEVDDTNINETELKQNSNIDNQKNLNKSESICDENKKETDRLGLPSITDEDAAQKLSNDHNSSHSNPISHKTSKIEKSQNVANDSELTETKAEIESSNISDKYTNDFCNCFSSIALWKLSKNQSRSPPIFPSAYTILQFVCSLKAGINIPEIKMIEINRFSLYYYRLLSYNKSHSVELLTFLLHIYYNHVNCSHLLYSITRIFLNTPADTLLEIDLFEKLRLSIFSYSYAYNTTGISDSLFAFLIKLYAKFKNYLETSEHINKDSWASAHSLMEYFLKLEKYGYKAEDCDTILEYEGFNRFIIDSLISEMPFSTVFTKY